MAVWAHQTFLQEGCRVKEQRNAPSPRLCSLLCTSRPIGGAMTSRSCRPHSPSVPALFFFFFFVQFCFTLLPVLYLKNNFKPRPCEYIRNEAYFDRVQYISHSDMDMQTGSNVQQVMIRDICAFGCTMGFSG